jgi:uncharacterized protein (TIGR01244 family)
MRFLTGLCVATVSLCLAVSSLADEPNEAEVVRKIEVGETPNVKTTGEKIFFGGQPAPEDFALFKDKGVKTIINLRSQEEVEGLAFNEEEIVKELGMNYVHVPLKGGQLDDDHLRDTVKAIAGARASNVLIHCASGNRVGFSWSLFQGTEGDEDVAKAIAMGKDAGMRSERLEARAQKFLEDVGPTWEKLPQPKGAVSKDK